MKKELVCILCVALAAASVSCNKNDRDSDPEINGPKDSETFRIEDPVARAICVKYFDTDNDGRLTYGEIRSVKNIRVYFKESQIKTFDEFKYFTGLTEIPASAFYDCRYLEQITLPSSLTHIRASAFNGCSPEGMTCLATTPPIIIWDETSYFYPNKIFVPAASVEAYKKADGWSDYAKRIYPIQ